MAIYVVGDIQGCYDELQQLLEQLRFDPANDQLWFVGDVVNRGPRSLESLRFVRELGDSAIMVLGNHDLHLLAISEGIRSSKRRDTLDKILAAPDASELLLWLRQRPLLHYNKRLKTLMVHAGLPQEWSRKQALKRATEVETILRGPHYQDFLKVMYGNEPSRWDKKLAGMERLRFITNALTRIRYCTPDGSLDMINKQSPGSQPQTLTPWFAMKQRRSQKTRIVFGHWSTLGYLDDYNCIALDTGCLWGGRMTAIRLDTRKIKPLSINCPGAAPL